MSNKGLEEERISDTLVCDICGTVFVKTYSINCPTCQLRYDLQDRVSECQEMIQELNEVLEGDESDERIVKTMARQLNQLDNGTTNS